MRDYTAVLALTGESDNGGARVDAHYMRGVANEKLGDLQAAIADFTEALRLEPTHVKAILARGACHNLASDYEAACGAHRRCLRICKNPSSSDTPACQPLQLNFSPRACPSKATSAAVRSVYGAGAFRMLPLGYAGRQSGAVVLTRRCAAAEDYAAALRIDEQRRKGGGRSARSGEADDSAASLIKAVYRPASSGKHVMLALSKGQPNGTILSHGVARAH